MKKIVLAVAATLALAGSMHGQTPATNDDFIRLDFSLKEMEAGKLVNTRTYQMMARINDPGISSIRSGGRVPVMGEKGFTYIDVGTNLDVRRVSRLKDDVVLELTAEVSGAMEIGEGKPVPANPPSVRQTRWNSSVLIPLRKPVVVFSSDDPASRRQLQLEVTATPMR
jgi:hypothetical protein